MVKTIALAFLTVLTLHGQYSTTVAGRQQDLDYVANTVPRLHGRFFEQLDPVVYKQAVANLGARIAASTDAEFYVGLAQLLALAGDMHTSLTPGGPFGYPFMPLSFLWFDDGLFVVSAAPEYGQTLGTKVVAVNGMPFDQVVQRLGTAFAYNNDQWLHSQVSARVGATFMLQGLGILPSGVTTVPVTFQTIGGTQFTVSIAPSKNALISGLPGPTPDYLQNLSSYYSYSYSAANRLIYARYIKCYDDPNGISVAAYSAQILQALDSNPVDTVVIDFRFNAGGNGALLNPLAAGLFERMARLRANPNFRIYLVIDKNTFSSGMYTPMAFKTGFAATSEGVPNVDTSGVMFVIGEPTGGKPVGTGNVLPFSLPYSKAAGQYSTEDVSVILDANLPSFPPDIYVSNRSTDYFAGHDPVMAAMLARFTGPPAPPSGEVITVNAASFRVDQELAPGSYASAFGTFPVTPDEVQVGGVPGNLVSAGLSQVNFVVPASIAPGPTTISVRAGGQELSHGQATVTAAGPGIFVLDPANPAQPGAVENQDYSVNSTANPASRGSILSVYATGYGADAEAYFGDTPATVLYGAPVDQYPGLWQVNVQVPATVPAGQLTLFILAGHVASNAVTVSVK